MLDKDTIISLANEAGIKGPAPARAGFKMYANPQRLLSFAALVAAHECEACAKLCDEKVDAEYKTGKVDHHEMAWTQACAIAIRARGEQ
jgi:hypothetical protein